MSFFAPKNISHARPEFTGELQSAILISFVLAAILFIWQGVSLVEASNWQNWAGFMLSFAIIVTLSLSLACAIQLPTEETDAREMLAMIQGGDAPQKSAEILYFPTPSSQEETA